MNFAFLFFVFGIMLLIEGAMMFFTDWLNKEITYIFLITFTLWLGMFVGLLPQAIKEFLRSRSSL